MAGAIDKESKMKFIVCAATAVFLLWGTPVLAGPCADVDGDSVCDVADNCLTGIKSGANPAQDDSDGDLCGNICDPNFANNGLVGFADILLAIGDFGTAVPTTVSGQNTRTNEPVTNPTGFADILDAIAYFSAAPGPSANSGTSVACP